jgi:ABC-2 type transport system ATP-binding protein
MDIITVNNLVKQYKNLTAVSGVSFSVGKGEIFAFLGPNGAGKSTTIGMLSTIITPTSGTAKVNGFDIVRERNDVRRSIGLVFQDPSLDDRLTAEENLLFHARLYGVPPGECKKRMEEVLRLVDLYDRRKDVVKTFSGGMKRRLEIARGLIHYPAVLFLDEPTLGLDPQTRNLLWEYILRLRREKNMTIFMTTHYMGEAEFSDRIAVIDHGKIVALDTPNNLKKMVGEDAITLEGENNAVLKKELEEKFGLKVREEDGLLVFGVTDGDKFLPRLMNELNARIKKVELRKPTLDDVFLHLTGTKIRDENTSASGGSGVSRHRHR